MNSEAEAEAFLEERELRVERFSKEEMRKGKTPDFRVYDKKQLVFYCEVKEAEKDSWLDDQLNETEIGMIAGGLRSDPVFNRLTAHIHKARKQFESVNPCHSYPNVLFIKNNDKHVGFNDLLGVVTGYFFADDGTAHKIYANYSNGRMVDDLKKVDLIIWLDEHKPSRYLFITTDKGKRERLGEYISYDVSKLRNLVI